MGSVLKGNSILNKAKHSENTDEWYTDYAVIEKEVDQYKEHFNNKIVLCNSDDPFKSSFAKYFMKNFNKLKLKKLICTSYKDSNIHKEISFNNELDLNYGYRLLVDRTIITKDVTITDENYLSFILNNSLVKNLEGDGDFRSEECLEYLKEADITVTNPPFSKFKELFSILEEHNKKYLLISNQNAILYKEVFPFIKNNLTWSGYHFGDMAFKVPKSTPARKTRFWIDDTGQKWRSLGNAMWLTNLPVNKENLELNLTHKYNSSSYPKYDHYDAIHVKKVAEIPYDYEGIMGVPLTYIKYHNKKKFTIIGEANHGSDNQYDLFKPIVNGKEVYKRILIKKNSGIKDKKYKILDLFCGAGGLSHGMHLNKNFETVVALDINEKLSQTLKNNNPTIDLIIGDIQNNDIKEKVIKNSLERKVNMVVGGPPCQGFSLKGKKLGLEDPRNFLFVEYLNVVSELQPEVFVIENVKSLLSTSNGWFKNQIISEIEKLGYTVSVGVLNARDFGVPQSRERAIFICSKNSIIELPSPTVLQPVTVREAIEDLAYLNSSEGSFEQEYITPAISSYQKKMREGSNKLYNHQASNHKDIAIEKLKLIPPEKGKEYLPKELLGKQQYKSTWGRLRWDQPSATIDTRFDAASNGTNNHPFLHRSITPREAARLQSFDDNYIFYGNKVDIRVQIGNAVPPLMGKAIADKIYRSLEEESI